MKERIVTHTKEELQRKKGKTDFDRLRKTTDRDIEEQVKRDPDSVVPSEEELQDFKNPKTPEKEK